MKKGYKKGWFVAEGKWWIETLCDDGNPVEVLNSFNEDCEYFPCYRFLLFTIISRLNVLLIFDSLWFCRCDMG